jgi:hypothetical protein
LHGFYLIVNHAWQSLRRRLGHDLERRTAIGTVVASAFTFLAVAVGWVFFRADTLSTARRLLESMFVFHGAHVSPFYAFVIQDAPVARWLRLVVLNPTSELVLLIVLALPAGIAFFAPNTQEIFRRYYSPPLQSAGVGATSRAVLWTPRRAFALVAAAAAAWAILGLTQVSEFLYFQF